MTRRILRAAGIVAIAVWYGLCSIAYVAWHLALIMLLLVTPRRWHGRQALPGGE